METRTMTMSVKDRTDVPGMQGHGMRKAATAKEVRSIVRICVLILVCLLLPGGLAAHDEGHEIPDTMPPVGPHGGEYTKLTHHFGEIVLRGNMVTVYILEADIKTVAQDASGIKLYYQVPGEARKSVSLQKSGPGYRGQIQLPGTARRVTFTIECVMHGKPEKGSLNYEIRR